MVIIVFVVGAILVGYAIGAQNLAIAAAVAVIAAVIFYQIWGGARDFIYTLVQAAFALGVAGAFQIIWGVGRNSISFWVVYAIAILVLIILDKREARKAEENTKEPLKKLRIFLQDYSQFMTDHYREAAFSSRAGKYLIVELWTYDAEVEQNAYREFDQHNVDPTEYFFGSYKPQSKYLFLCYSLLEKGTPKFGDDSLLAYEQELSMGKFDFNVIMQHMRLVYQDSFKKIGRDSFSISFPAGRRK